MAARTIIVGDVHGMAEELRQLMRDVGLSLADRVVFVGDLLDKGPHSCAVVAYAWSLRNQGVEVILVRGNHEDKHARFRIAFEKAGEKGIKKFKGVEELRAITEGLSEQEVDFLDSAVPFFKMPEHNAIVVHGGILPEWDELDADNKGIVSRLMRVRHITEKVTAKVTIELTLEGMDDEDITYMRHAALVHESLDSKIIRRQIRPAGSFISLGNEGSEDPFWADVYGTDVRGPRFGHVYFGHSPFPESEEPVEFDHATGLDLGCVFGGHLAAVVLEGDQPRKSFMVKASGKFATSFDEE